MTQPVAADAAVRISLEGMSELRAELGSLKSELLKAIGTNTKVQAISAIRDGFAMVRDVISRAASAASYFFRNVTNASERVAEMQKIADRLGTTVEFISKMRVASITSNMSLNEFEQSMAAFQRNLETFSQGVGESKQTFENLGITPDMVRGWGTLENQMLNIILRLKQVQDPSQRAGAAMRIFGEQGRKLIPMVNANSEALLALMKITEFLGVSIDDTFGRNADRYRDSVRHLSLAIEGLWNTLSSASLPLINSTLENLIVSVKTFTDLQGELGGIEEGFMGIADAAAQAGKVLLGLEITAKRIEAGKLGLENMLYDANAAFVTEERRRQHEAGMEPRRQREIALNQQINDMMFLYNQFDERFKSNLAEYQALRDAATPAENALQDTATAMLDTATEANSAAEKIKSAAQILANAFRGEAIGQDAASASRLSEMNRQVLGDIRMYLQRIDRGLSSSPVVRTVY